MQLKVKFGLDHIKSCTYPEILGNPVVSREGRIFLEFFYTYPCEIFLLQLLTDLGAGQRTFKLLYNCTHFTCSRFMFKILQDRLQQYVTQELSGVQDWFRKGRGTRDQIANIH